MQRLLSAMNSSSAKIFFTSVLALFLELLCIRWISTEIRVFAYLQNFVLTICFLGLGIGCLDTSRPFRLRDVLLPLLGLLLLLTAPPTRGVLLALSSMLSLFSTHVVWGDANIRNPVARFGLATTGLLVTFGLSFLIWRIFLPLGRLLGSLMASAPNKVRAYSLNIVGSLVGLWAFVGLGALSQPPWVWFAVAVALMLLFVARDSRQGSLELAMLGAVAILAVFATRAPGAMQVRWSPYQKLVLREGSPETLLGDYLIEVNNIGYQGMLDLGPDSSRRTKSGYSQYDIPYLLHPSPRQVLIVGAGAGNDVAAALRAGAEHVVAVEIDPAILEMGRRYHPEKPYDSPKVEVVLDDARAYFARSTKTFDLIVFGLLDSHTTTSMTNQRLDHFVYTRESMIAAKGLLATGGILTLTFSPQRPFIADRLANVLRDAFVEAPRVIPIPKDVSGWGGVLYVAGAPASVTARIEERPELAAQIARWKKDFIVELPGTAQIATDDWPFLYLEAPRIPLLYLLLAVILVVLHFWTTSSLGLPAPHRWVRPDWHFFFLGAAFFLLEVQNISKAAVVLGNTWTVNAVIISAILGLALVANGLVLRFPAMPLRPVFAILIGVCLALWFLDVTILASLPYPLKAAAVGVLTCLPMLFSGIIFTRAFVEAPARNIALGINLVGALVGGLLQSMTFMTGIRALLLAVAMLYFCAFLTRPADAKAATACG